MLQRNKEKTKPNFSKVAHFHSLMQKAISVITHYTQVFFMPENVISKSTVKKEDKTNITNYMTTSLLNVSYNNT